MYQKIHDMRPDLALVCLSIIPGDIPPGFQPSLDTAFYMAAIYDSPKKGLNDSYATHFLNLRGVVSTEYLTNFMASEATVAVLHDPATGLTTCDFVIAPERLSVDFYGTNIRRISRSTSVSGPAKRSSSNTARSTP